jgi:hypothetical protein
LVVPVILTDEAVRVAVSAQQNHSSLQPGGFELPGEDGTPLILRGGSRAGIADQENGIQRFFPE